MKYLFQLTLSIVSLNVTGQVIFSTPIPTAVAVDTSLRTRPRLLLTYGGRPADDTTATLHQPLRNLAQGGADGVVFKRPQTRSASIEDSLIRLEDSLMVLLMKDSLALLDRRLKIIRSVRTPRHQYLLRDVPSILPLRIDSWQAYRVSSGFGLRIHPITAQYSNHSGIDFPQPVNTPVYATADGVVSRTVWQPEGLGNAVYIHHDSDYTTVYGHLTDYSVDPGTYVHRGQCIGHVGSTGMSTGPHLHYSVLDRGVPVDPSEFCFLLMKTIRESEAARQSARSR